MRAATYHPPKDGATGAGYWEQRIPGQEFYSIQDASTILGIGTTQIYGAIDRGTISGYWVANVKKIKHEDLVEYIAKRPSVGQVSERGAIQRITPRAKGQATTTPPVPGVVTEALRPPAPKPGAPHELMGGLDLAALDAVE